MQALWAAEQGLGVIWKKSQVPKRHLRGRGFNGGPSNGGASIQGSGARPRSRLEERSEGPGQPVRTGRGRERNHSGLLVPFFGDPTFVCGAVECDDKERRRWRPLPEPRSSLHLALRCLRFIFIEALCEILTVFIFFVLVRTELAHCT